MRRRTMPGKPAKTSPPPPYPGLRVPKRGLVLSVKQVGLAITAKGKPVGVITARIVKKWVKTFEAYRYALEAHFRGRKYGPRLVCETEEGVLAAYNDWAENLVNPDDCPESWEYAPFWAAAGEGGKVESWLDDGGDSGDSEPASDKNAGDTL